MTRRPCKAADEGQAVEGDLGQETRGVHCARQQKQTRSREMDGSEGSSRPHETAGRGQKFSVERQLSPLL